MYVHGRRTDLATSVIVTSWQGKANVCVCILWSAATPYSYYHVMARKGQRLCLHPVVGSDAIFILSCYGNERRTFVFTVCGRQRRHIHIIMLWLERPTFVFTVCERQRRHFHIIMLWQRKANVCVYILWTAATPHSYYHVMATKGQGLCSQSASGSDASSNLLT